VAAPLLLLAVTLLEPLQRYPLPNDLRLKAVVVTMRDLGSRYLFAEAGFRAVLGCQVIIVALVLLGLRRLALAALAAMAVFWIVTHYWIVAWYWIPYPVQLLTVSVFILEAAALIASPGPRRGRALMTGGHWAVLVLVAAAVLVSVFIYDAAALFPLVGRANWLYCVVGLLLVSTAVDVAVVVKMNRCLLLLLAAMLYPYVVSLADASSSSGGQLIRVSTPTHLAVLYGPSLLAAGWAALTAVAPLRSRALPTSTPQTR
jgi:hypothetical protein